MSEYVYYFLTADLTWIKYIIKIAYTLEQNIEYLSS